jgi:hypothetical protein
MKINSFDFSELFINFDSSPIVSIYRLIGLSITRFFKILESAGGNTIEMHKNPSCARISLMEMDSMLGGEKQHRVTK